MLSIIIPAYRAQDYIEECLDSIYAQEYMNKVEYEVIVASDGCEKTLNKLKKIRNKYNNLRIISMYKNYGLFITFNTLLSIVSYDEIVKFDSDDIMLPNFLEEVMRVDADLVRFQFYFYPSMKPCPEGFYAMGVYRMNRRVIDFLGGFQPWKCAAGGEFLRRFKQCGFFKQVRLDKKLFYYRRHNNTLSNKFEFKKGSLRERYKNSYKDKIYTDFRIEPVVGDYVEIME